MDTTALNRFSAAGLWRVTLWAAMATGMPHLVARPAGAAEITDVADAADVVKVGNTEREDFFDAYVGTRFEGRWGSGRITREPIYPSEAAGCTETSPRGCLPVDELKYNHLYLVQTVSAEFGVFHDLSITLELPIIIADNVTLDYANGVDEFNSSVDPAGETSDMFAHNLATFHRGVGGMALGLRFAPLSDERDDTKPTWVVFFNWRAPWTSKTFKPKVETTRSAPGAVGDGVHRLTLGTAFSKRVGSFGLIGIDPSANRRGYVDPYMTFSYTYPIPQESLTVDALHEDAAPLPNATSHVIRLAAGVEIVPYEKLDAQHKVAVDLGIRSAFHSEGRNYSLLTEALDRLTYTEQYAQVEGMLGLAVHANEFVRFQAGFTVGAITEHFLTFESELLGEMEEVNEKFDRDLDLIGRRFKDEAHFTRGFFASLLVTL